MEEKIEIRGNKRPKKSGELRNKPIPGLMGGRLTQGRNRGGN